MSSATLAFPQTTFLWISFFDVTVNYFLCTILSKSAVSNPEEGLATFMKSCLQKCFLQTNLKKKKKSMLLKNRDKKYFSQPGFT